MGILASVVAAAALAAPGFSQHAGRLVVSAPGYRVTLSAQNGRIEEIDDAQGRKLLGASYGCLWWLNPDHHSSSVGGCSQRPTHRWNARTSTLTLTYGSLVTVTLHAAPSYFDLRLRLVNSGVVRDQIRFPAGLAGDTRTVEAGYAPDVLPGVKLAPAFFSRVGNPIQVYPSRWAFADYLALDANGGHVALYSVNRGPIAPLSFGLPAPRRVGALLRAPSTACCTSSRRGCGRHARWTSPTVRIRVGETAQQTILDYRRDNGIDAYPSLAAKLGARLPALARRPSSRRTSRSLALPFAQWEPSLRRLPSPILLHPVAYQPDGHDDDDPDFLPPDPRWGTTADLAALIGRRTRSATSSCRTTTSAGGIRRRRRCRRRMPTTVGVLDEHGVPQTIDYGVHQGVIVSPFATLVRAARRRSSASGSRSAPTACFSTRSVPARGCATSTRRPRPRSPTTTAGSRCSRRTRAAA